MLRWSYDRIWRLEIVVKREDELWLMAEDIYYSGFIQFATGESLDKAVALLGIRRKPATRATGIVTFRRSTPATSDIIIPAGTRVATADESIVFRTTQAVTLTAGSTSVDAPIEAVEPGSAGKCKSHERW